MLFADMLVILVYFNILGFLAEMRPVKLRVAAATFQSKLSIWMPSVEKLWVER